MEFFKQLFSSDFLPHGTCYLWDPHIVWLHVVSDSLITLAYYCIPLALVYLVRKRRDFPFNWIFWMFGLFILGCGTTHLLEVWTVWHGTYLLSGVVKALTAAVSVVTAAMLIPLIPKAVALPGRGQLQAINQELKHQVARRSQRELELIRLTQDLEAANKPLASPVRGNWKEVCRECLDLMRRCVYVDKDLVLPAMATNGPEDTFYIVASTDMERVNIMTARIVEQISVLTHLKATGTIRATARPVKFSREIEDKSLMQQVELVGESVTHMVLTDLRTMNDFNTRETNANAN